MGAAVDEDGCDGEENRGHGEEEGDSDGRGGGRSAAGVGARRPGLAGGGGPRVASLRHMGLGSGQQECGSKEGGSKLGLTPSC